MSNSAQPTSIRLTEATRLMLDKSARQMRRSRSYLVEEALKAQLPGLAEKEIAAGRESAMQLLLEIRKRAEAASKGLTAEEIEARARDFRGDD